MRVTKDDLKLFGLFDKLPINLKELEAGDNYFIFYYTVDEVNVTLKVYETSQVKELNVSLYRGISQKAQKYNSNEINIGFFKDTFETRDGLFYQFLRTYNDIEDINNFYRWAVDNDKLVNISVSTSAVSGIFSSEDFRRTISYFCSARLQTIMFVYDMVNSVFQSRLSKSLYGEAIKQVVNLIKYDGGVLPQINGSLRFMIIGENAKLTAEQKEKLTEAKMLLRSLEKLENIYKHTGWAFSDSDGKWRTNIADDEAAIDSSMLYDYNGRKLYIPKGNTQQDVTTVLSKPQDVYNLGYKGRLSDILKHPTLYTYYPKLAIMPIIYFYGKSDLRGLEPKFYFSANERGGYILINGSISDGDSLSIMLHEIQHSIQNIEGYARGGNLFFAQFVASVGGAQVRRIFSSINRMERIFREELYNEESRLGLIQAVKDEYAQTGQARSLKNTLLGYLNNEQSYYDDYKTITFYVILFVAENADYVTSNITQFLIEKLGDNSSIIYELFENITEGYNEAVNYKKILVGKGFIPDEYDAHGNRIKINDVGMILFKGYENLYGEMESRSVQESRLVSTEFKNYFYLTTWEHTPLQNITVIDGIEKIIDCTEIKAALETKDEEYVLHFEKSNSCTPFLHELGHIIYDALVKLGNKEAIDKAYQSDYDYPNIDEFFVAKFLGYLRERLDDEKMRKDFRLDFSISSNKDINEILDEFFSDVYVGERLKFVQTILSL